VLLLLFLAGIGLSLARGRRPDCRCFGQLHSEPVGRSTLARNGVLAAVAGFLAWQAGDEPGPSLVGWLAELSAIQVAGLGVGALVLGLLAVGTWLLLHLLRQHGRLLLRIEALETGLGGAMSGPGPAPRQGLSIGAVAPAFALPDLDGKEVTLDALRAEDRPILLLFTDSNCNPCTALTPEIGRWRRDHADQLTIPVVSRGSPEENRDKAAEHDLELILLQRDYEVATAYHAHGTPSAVLVRPDGTIGSSVAAGAEAIRSLVAHAIGPSAEQPWDGAVPLPVLNGQAHGHGRLHRPLQPVSLKIGEPAPALTLPDLDGETVDLANLRGHRVLILFWHPGCGFCKQMLPDLKAWEASPPEGAPRLLIVSAGTVEANRALGFRSRVVLDQEFSAGPSFGAHGTPMAVLVDAEGRVASDVAIGAQAVLTLAGAQSHQAPTGSR
jgi:methylamine dehydrogenase accessory protein MauD